MCFNFKISFTMSIVGLIASYFFYKKINIQVASCIFFFTLMEIIQSIGYLVIDKCDNITNKLMSYANYIHISFQHIVILFFYYSLMKFYNLNSMPSNVFNVLMIIAIISGIFMFLRMFLFTKNQNYDTNCVLCGPKPCVKKGKYHLKIEIPLRTKPEYFTPNFFIHFLFFFIPPLFMGKYAIIIDLFIFFGLLVIHYFVNASIEETTTTWCLFSIAQLIGAISISYMFNKTKGKY